ncbi:hypothetical protein [Crocosphaera chwakensis]|uniref:Uncharacterized protein n=1 Tax=Crocosphaera chwakensis CCY0110 TaxID=391612 RepID=A3IXC2_9CHRO|nr:hypothetical protein [Crocosphaera chwakensis]EAZ88865.1 hypothetical protein CY0110_31265 [Crocosphaera chwakensis CCY0110]
MTMTLTRQQPSLWNRLLDKLSFSGLLAISSGSMFLHLWQTFVTKGNLELVALFVYSTWMALIALCTFLYWQETPHRQLNRLQNWLSKYGLAPIAWLVGTAIFLFDSYSLPVMAQAVPGGGGGTGPAGSAAGFFFTNIQNKATNIFSGSPQATTINPIIRFGFGVLQILFIMFIAWQVAKVIGAAREEEDWKQVAKTPLIVAAAVIGGDFAIGLV